MPARVEGDATGILGSAFVALTVTATMACGSSARSGEDSIHNGSFGDRFVVADSVSLEEPDSAPLVRLSGLDATDDGRLIAVGDGSEGNVRLYDRSGRLLRVIGRKGRGPGEFERPWFPRFAANGLLYVADASYPRVQWFTTSGEYVGGVPLAGVAFVSGFELVRDAGFLILDFTRDSILMLLDSAGAVRRRYMPRPEPPPVPNSRDDPMWRSILRYALSLDGDTALVTASTSDSIWAVSLSSGATTATSLRFPGYLAPRLPDPSKPPPMENLGAWLTTFDVAMSPMAGGGRRAVHFARGILHYGDPRTLVFRDSTGSWTAASDAPIVLRLTRGGMIAMLRARETGGPVTLARFIPRGN